MAILNRTHTSLAARAVSNRLSRRILGLRHPIVVFLAIGFLSLAGCGGGEEAKEEESQAPSLEDMQSALDQAVAAGIPGIALEIQSSEGSEFLTAGSASLEDERSLVSDDRFRIASVTKAFTAAVVMELVEEGALSLDDTVEDWAPGLLAEGDSITVRQLLGHTSGLPEYIEDDGFIEAFIAGEYLTPRQIVSFVSSEPLAFEPGTEYEYSDTDNIVLGMIIESATGSSYEEELRTRVLEPLDLQDTVLPEGTAMPDPHARGYQYEPGSEGGGEPEDVTTALDPSAAWASGALVSTPSNLSSFFGGLLGGQLIGEDELEQMKEAMEGEGSPPGPGTKRAGLGIFSYELPCGSVWGHTGSFPGYQTFGAATQDGSGSLAMMATATEVSDQAKEALVEAQELAACRALG